MSNLIHYPIKQLSVPVTCNSCIKCQNCRITSSLFIFPMMLLLFLGYVEYLQKMHWKMSLGSKGQGWTLALNPLPSAWNNETHKYIISQSFSVMSNEQYIAVYWVHSSNLLKNIWTVRSGHIILCLHEQVLLLHMFFLVPAVNCNQYACLYFAYLWSNFEWDHQKHNRMLQIWSHENGNRLLINDCVSVFVHVPSIKMPRKGKQWAMITHPAMYTSPTEGVFSSQ